MISEIKLIIFASAIYYFFYHFDLFKIVDSIMEGNDENIIFFSTVILVFSCVYIMKKISEYKYKPDELLGILKNCKDTLETYNMYEPSNDQCQKYMNNVIPDDRNALIILLTNILKCIKIRLIVNDCDKNPQQNICLVDFIITNLPDVKENDNINKTAEEIIAIIEQETKNDPVVNNMKMVHSLIDNLIFATNQDINKIEGYLSTLIIKGESSDLLHKIEVDKLKDIKAKLIL